MTAQADSGHALDEEPMDLGGVKVFKPQQFSGYEAIESVGYHGHDDIKVHLHQYRGRKRIQVAELDGLGDHVLHPPTSGVIARQ